MEEALHLLVLWVAGSWKEGGYGLFPVGIALCLVEWEGVWDPLCDVEVLYSIQPMPGCRPRIVGRVPPANTVVIGQMLIVLGLSLITWWF